MTLYEIAIRDHVCVGVIEELSRHWAGEVTFIYMSEYGLTICAEITDDAFFKDYDWAFSMICNMEQEVKL